MSTATGRVSGADTRARGWRSPVGSACAVHTEVAAANVVTPSAAARSRPFQRLPLCRAMSARPFAVSADVVHRCRAPMETGERPRGLPLLPITDETTGGRGQSPASRDGRGARRPGRRGPGSRAVALQARHRDGAPVRARSATRPGVGLRAPRRGQRRPSRQGWRCPSRRGERRPSRRHHLARRVERTKASGQRPEASSLSGLSGPRPIPLRSRDRRKPTRRRRGLRPPSGQIVGVSSTTSLCGSTTNFQPSLGSRNRTRVG